jgi:hypothetical protein
MQKDHCRRLAITTALGAGDNTLVAAAQLGTGIGSIRVWQIELESSGAETVTPKSGTTAIPGKLIIPVAGTLVLQGTGIPWQECLPGQALVWSLATGTTLTGTIYYTLA